RPCVDLDPVPAESVAVRKPRVGERPRRGGGACDRVAGLPLTVVRPDVLNPDDSGLRTAEVPPRRPAHERLPDAVDAPVEVVRREECEVAADVAVPLDHVVLVTRHVFLMAWEDDEVVTPRELVTARDRVEVVVREEVDGPARPGQPRDG